MQVLVKKRGNSASVRIPASIMEAANLRLDQPVDIREEAGSLIVQPVREAEIDLANLLAEITDDNIHQEIDFGPPVGQERL